MSDSSPSSRGHEFHYAWLVLICAFAFTSLYSLVRHSFGVFIDPLVETHGWSRGDISLAYSAMFISAAAVSLGLGPLTERLGARRMMLLGIAGTTSGLLLTGTVTALWQLYLYYGLLFGGLGVLLNVVIPVAVTRWFAKSVGVALGLMWVSLGVGGMLGPLAFRWLLSTVGWQTTFFLAGSVIGGAMLLALLFFRARPRDMNMPAYGEELIASQVMDVETGVVPPPAHLADFAFIRRSAVLWYLISIHFLGCLGHSVLLAHIVSIAISNGVPSLTAAGILSTIAATSTISLLSMPIMAEKLGGRRTLALAFVLQASPIPFLFVATQAWQFYVIAFFFGLGFGGEMPTFPIINRQYWGLLSPLNAIYSWQLAGAWAGMALGGWLGGALFDMTGSYMWSIGAAFLFTAVGLAPILSLPHHRSGIILARSDTE